MEGEMEDVLRIPVCEIYSPVICPVCAANMAVRRVSPFASALSLCVASLQCDCGHTASKAYALPLPGYDQIE
jgi:hypothetical protein